MTGRAAHLVEEVLPRVPVQQWVLSLPHRLPYLLAWNHTLCRAVLGVLLRARPVTEVTTAVPIDNAPHVP